MTRKIITIISLGLLLSMGLWGASYFVLIPSKARIGTNSLSSLLIVYPLPLKDPVKPLCSSPIGSTQLCESVPTNLNSTMFGFRGGEYFELASAAERVVLRLRSALLPVTRSATVIQPRSALRRSTI